MLDLLDQSLLYELDNNSRLPISQLSSRLKAKRDRVAYRLKGLKESGILRKCTVLVDPYRFGLTIFKVYLQLNHDRKRRDELLKTLWERPDIYWFAEMEGRFDVAFAMYAPSPFEFSSTLDEVLDSFRDLVRKFNVCTLVEVWLFRKRFLKGVGAKYVKIGGAPENHPLDAKDFLILAYLAEDSRTSTKDIAERLGSSPTLVTTRIARMEKLGVIIGYQTEIDLGKLGLSSFKARVDVRKHDSQSLDALFDYARLNNNLVIIIRQLGDCKVELEFEVRDFEQYSEIIEDLKDKFPRLIREIETVAIKRQTYKWMPFHLTAKL